MMSGICRFVGTHGRVMAASLSVVFGLAAPADELQLPVVKTKTGSYTNVTVFGKSSTDIFVRHSRGLCNIKIGDLTPETLAELGPGYSSAPTDRAGQKASRAKSGTSGPMQILGTPAMQDLKAQFGRGLTPGLALIPAVSTIRPSASLLLGLLGILLAVYLFFCYCLKLICEKAGHKPGVMVWIPILQVFPMLQAARMSGWWFLAFLVPVLNLVAHILWSIKIVQARGKDFWVSILLVFPITNLIAFFYLAFSSAAQSEEEGEDAAVRISLGSPALGEA